MALEEADEGTVVQLLPSIRWRGHDHPSHAVLEDQPSACGARERPRHEMTCGPGTSEALLPNGPEISMPVAKLTRKGERPGTFVPVGSRVDELVTWRDE